LAGTVGASKSLAVMQAMLHWLREGINVTMYALERRLPDHLQRALAQLSGNAEHTRDEWVRSHPEEVSRDKEQHGRPWSVSPSTCGLPKVSVRRLWTRLPAGSKARPSGGSHHHRRSSDRRDPYWESLGGRSAIPPSGREERNTYGASVLLVSHRRRAPRSRRARTWLAARVMKGSPPCC
jgi:hypothetical protein